MKKEFLAIAIFLISSNIAVAQWPDQAALGGSSGNGGMLHRPMPAAPRANLKPPFLKGDETLAETWSSTIAAEGNNPDGMTIYCMAADSDNLYVSGDFSDFDSVAEAYDIVHYNRKTGVWNAMGNGLSFWASSMVVHNGELYAAGSFSALGNDDSSIDYLAVWDGTSWHGIGGGMNSRVSALAFIGDTLYAGGYFTQAGGNSINYLAYWNGTSWNEVAGGLSGPVYSLLATHDTLFVGGDFEFAGGQTIRMGIPAYGTAMLKDGTWNSMGNGYSASSLAMYHDTIWAGGNATENGTFDETVNNIVFWDGSSWNTVSSDTVVGTNGTGPISELLTVGDTLLALGSFGSISGNPTEGIAMYRNGKWSEFAGGLYGAGEAAVSFNGNLIVGGAFTQAGNTNCMGIASLSNGIWTSLASIKYPYVGWYSDEVLAIATTSRYVFVGGYFITIAGQVCNHIAAYDKQQGKWTTLGSGVDGYVTSLAILNDTTLVVAGLFNRAGAVSSRHIAMYNIPSGTWAPMGEGAYLTPLVIAVKGSNVYALIYGTLIGSNLYASMGEWNGTQWIPFGNGFVNRDDNLTLPPVFALAWHNDTLYAGGGISVTDDGTQVNYIAQIQPGGPWSSLNSGMNSGVDVLTVSGDSLYAGGNFTQADGQISDYLAVWNGSSWNPIGSVGINSTIYTLAPDGAGGVYAGGRFTGVANVSQRYLVHWNGSKFVSVGSGVNNIVETIATDADALYAGGWFETAGANTVSLHFAALEGAGASVSISSLPDVTSLSIYPNPASSSSTISVGLAKAGNVRIEIFNALGSRVALLADGNYQSGQQDFAFDASKLLSGIYFLRLTNNGVVSTENFIVERE